MSEARPDWKYTFGMEPDGLWLIANNPDPRSMVKLRKSMVFPTTAVRMPEALFQLHVQQAKDAIDFDEKDSR